MKQTLSLLLAYALLVAQGFAATATVSPSGASTNSIISEAIRITQVTVANGSTNALVVRLVDAPTNSLTYVRAAYTNRLSYTTNLVTSFTNFSGVVQSSTNLVLYTYDTLIPATTNSYNLVQSISVPASSTVTWTPTGEGVYANFGLLSTNNQACTISVQYNSAR